MRRLLDRWTIRARLTALTAALVLAAGTVIVLGGWWWLTASLHDAVRGVSDGGALVSVEEAAPIPVGGHDSVIGRAHGALPGSEAAPDTTGAIPVDSVDLAAEAVRAASQNLESEVARHAALQSIVLLVVLTVAAVGIGWFAARRALAPVHGMTDAARALGGGSLAARLPVDGLPRDEVRELGETFNELLDRVEGSVLREQRLLANVSHELRTPLANQRVVLDLALERVTDDDEPLVAAARQALDQNLRAHRLIEQMLLLARIEQADTGPRDSENIALVALVERLVDEPALAGLGPAGVRVDVVRSADDVIVRGEEVLMERLVGNVIENAVRHNVADGWVSVEVLRVNGRPEMLVSNTGPVVDSADVASLFMPFRRGAPVGGTDRVRSQEGAGLGLSVVGAVARRYGVDASASPRSGGGLVVRLRWPEPVVAG